MDGGGQREENVREELSRPPPFPPCRRLPGKLVLNSTLEGKEGVGKGVVHKSRK